jgi:phosphoglycolate phosphatase
MKFKQILFDLDGTVTDPKVGITNSVKYSLVKFGINETDVNKLVQFIGPPLQNSYKDIYGFSESDSKLAVDYYREYYSDKGIFENELYPGIEELLTHLENKNKTIILATSKPTIFAERILAHFKISCFFKHVIGSNLDGTMTDKTELIKYILDMKLHLPDQTIMIGDRKYDIIGANNNNIKSIGVGYGYGSLQELKEAFPYCLCITMDELIDFFD